VSAGSVDSFSVRSALSVDGREYGYLSLPRLGATLGVDVARLPYSIRILLENLLRNEDGRAVGKAEIESLARFEAETSQAREIAFHPARVILQDFTGVPAVVDLAALRDAMAAMGGNPSRINPLFPAELVIDHSLQVDVWGTADAAAENQRREYERNRERYLLLRWAQTAFDRLRVVPPATGIVHQVNVEHLARVVFEADGLLYPDSVVGTDSHTTMVNGLGVLGWGVGGIEAEACMLGQPLTLLVPEVLGVRLHGALPEGATATDLVLTLTRALRDRGVVGTFVEFCGPGLASLPLADRATLSNMGPEFGCTCALFPIDAETIDYVRLSGRGEAAARRIEAYARAQGLFRTAETPEPSYRERLDLDLGSVVPTVAGPRRPHERVALSDVKAAFQQALPSLVGAAAPPAAPVPGELRHGSVVIAAITSCTNTSNPSVMMAAGLLAKHAVARGLTVQPHVKTSLAPGSLVVTDYLARADLLRHLEALHFHVVGYGCTTCIGNSGPLPEPVAHAIQTGALVAVSVLSGNRNFEGRIHALTRANYLASPPLVVAYALAGRIDIDFETEPLGIGSDGQPVFLRDVWPSTREIRDAVAANVTGEMFVKRYADVFQGDAAWRALPVPDGARYAWDPDSTYVRLPPFFEGMPAEPPPLVDLAGARVLVKLGHTVTTDHISPAGSIPRDSAAGRYLVEHGVLPADFNSYGARRGNHEVMMRGTFGSVRLRNQLVPGVEGGFTKHLPSGETTTIYDAAMRYRREGVPLLVLAGKEYGSGSSRDWAAKGTFLLGVRAVIAESYERIHRSNLVGMGVLPLQYDSTQNAESLGLSGAETFDVQGVAEGLTPGAGLAVTARAADGTQVRFGVTCRIDTAVELDYFRHGGILPYVLRQLLRR
jgi:aconitate hydratase